MIHKKKYHAESFPICHDFRDGKCDQPIGKCWYRHDNKASELPSSKDKLPSHQDFPKLPEQSKPPDYAQKTPVKMDELEEMVKKALQLIMNVDGKLKLMRT